ncbi:MAG: GNAT family N-acetyltransferase [Candidatus Nanohalobium sp.]
MKIRKYRESDAEEKHELHMKTIREVASPDYSDTQIDAWTTFDPDNATDEDKTERWIAVEDDKIVGFGDYVPEEEEITGIYVHPGYLRKGIASRLLEKVEEDARERGIKKLSLVSTVTAKEFYEEHGYSVLGSMMYETGGEELETFRMEKNLQ